MQHDDGSRTDLVLALTDVSTSLRSRARRLITSPFATLGLYRSAPSTGGEIGPALGRLCDALEQSGFRVVRALSGAEALEAGGAPGDVLLLLHGAEARLQREYDRERLNIWLQSRTSDQAEFLPQEAPPGEFTPARRVGLLYAPLLELLDGQLRDLVRADLAVCAVYPIHHRRFCATLLSHLCRRPLLQAQHLHALRSEYGEKVAFLFAFRSHQQRWLCVPALLGVLLWLSRFVSEQLPALLTPVFGLAVPVWASLLLEAWRERQHELASLWSVDELREAEVVRPDFVGARSSGGAFTGGAAQQQRRQDRLMRCVTIPVLGGQLLLLTAIITLLYAVWIAIHEWTGARPALKTLLVVLVSASWGLLVEFFNWHVFHRLASTLNHWENHRTTAEYEAHLVRKLFAFFFVDGFLWYFLLAFLHIPFGDQLRALLGLGDDTFAQDFWMHALLTSIATLLLGTVPLSAVWSVTPLIMRHRGAASGTSPHVVRRHRSRHHEDAAAPGRATGSVRAAGEAAYDSLCAAAVAVTSAADGAPAGGGETAAQRTPDARRSCAVSHLGGEEGSQSGLAATFAAADTQWGSMHPRGGVLEEALAIRQRRVSAPSALLGHVLPPRLPSDDDDDSECDGELCGRNHAWPRSIRLTSLLARKLPWPRHLHQRARRRHRTAVNAARRVAVRLANADATADEARRPVYDPMLDLARLSLEFGYVLMFTVVWPLAPLCCLLVSALEQRTAALRLTVGCQRPATGLRCDGLGTGNAWFHILQLLTWTSVPLNCGMIALATQQLDDAQAALHVQGLQLPLPPFEKLLVAVVAEHVLLAAKLVISVSSADGPSHLRSDADEEHRRKYLLGVHGLGEPDRDTQPRSPSAAPAQPPGSDAAAPGISSSSPPHDGGGGGGGGGGDGSASSTKGGSALTIHGGTASREPRLLSVFPTSGPIASGAAVSLRGEWLGAAVCRGELTLVLTLPKPGRAVTVPANFVSERKLTCVLPPSPTTGLASIELLLPGGKGSGSGPKGDGACTFRYCAPCSASRLRPSSGPVGGGTPVRMFGSGFVQTNELTAILQLHGVERRVPVAYVSTTEVRFLAPSFQEAGDAKVLLSLNGQEYEPATECVFVYSAPSVQCAIQ